MNVGEYTELLFSFSDAERCKAYTQPNTYHWPEIVSAHRPADWDTLSHKERHKHPEARALWGAIYDTTTPFGRSQAWWVEVLGRTEEQHMRWWTGNRPKMLSRKGGQQ